MCTYICGGYVSAVWETIIECITEIIKKKSGCVCVCSFTETESVRKDLELEKNNIRSGRGFKTDKR